MMFSVTVRDRVMIAHSFQGEVFGPAQALHGATYVVETEYQRAKLDGDGLVVDIGLAHEALSAALTVINYKNLDDLDVFKGINTTTEYLAGWIHGRIADAVAAGKLGPHAGDLTGLKVCLRESDVAWAAYEGPLS